MSYALGPSEISDAYPTLDNGRIAPVRARASGGRYLDTGERFDSKVFSDDLTWTGMAHNLVMSGAMPETSFQYPGGGIRPGNNEPEFVTKHMYTPDGGSTYYIPRMPRPAGDPVPHDPGSMPFRTA